MLDSDQDKEVDVSVVIPAYNEEKRIGFFLEKLIEFTTESSASYEIIVVADGCTDLTEAVVKRYSKAFPAVRLITFPVRLGKGGALKLGFSDCRGRLLIYMDADGGYDPKEIPRLLQALANADCAVGSRAFRLINPIGSGALRYDTKSVLRYVLLGARTHPCPPRGRRIAGYSFMWLVNFLFGEFGDTQAGFKGFRREVIEKISAQVTANGFDADVQFLVRAKRNGFKLAEVPVTYKFVEGSKVKTLKDGTMMGIRVLRFWFRLLLERLGLCKIPNS